ncbi:hypothetical protein JCM3770_000518 [Rhodotorula araucariae]
MAVPASCAPKELASHDGGAPAAASASSSLLRKVQRRISLRRSTTGSSNSSSSSLNTLREHLPKTLGGTPRADDGSVFGGVNVEEPAAYTIAPPDHRENTALHAMMDSLPSLGSFHPPQISSLNPLRSAPSVPCFSADGYDSDDDASPPATPPGSTPTSRAPSVAPPPFFQRRCSDPPKGTAPSDPLERLSGNVVMMGGFRGSVLRDAKTNKRLWIPLKVGFGLRRADLGLGLEEDDEMNSEERVIAGNMLTQIGGWIDLGRKLKDRLKHISASQLHPSSSAFPFTSSTTFPFTSSGPPSPRDPLHPPLRYHSFGYDWRRSLQLSSKLLVEKLVRLKEESALRGEGPGGNGLGATIVAHSMGGLVALHALASAPDPTVVRGILFAGTPFQGCINTLGAFKLGGGIALNQKVGSPAVTFSWRSGFYFLPRALPPADQKQAEEELPDLTLPPVVDAAVPQLAPRDASAPSTPTHAASARSSPTLAAPSTPPPSPAAPRGPASASASPSLPLHRLLSGGFETPKGEPIPVDFFDPQTWASYALSPVPAGMDFARPSLRPRPVPSAAASGSSDADADGSAHALGAFGAPGNLGERSVFPNVGGEAQDAVDEVSAQMREAFGAEDEDGGAQSDETERLRRQAREVDTVRRYLVRTLKRVREFQDDLVNLYDPAKAHLYPPLAVLTSSRTPTVRGILVSSREDIVREGYERLLWAAGDGIVLSESATRLPGDPEVEGRERTGRPEDDKWMAHLQGVVETSHGHVGLLGDIEGVRKGLELLYGCRN